MVQVKSGGQLSSDTVQSSSLGPVSSSHRHLERYLINVHTQAGRPLWKCPGRGDAGAGARPQSLGRSLPCASQRLEHSTRVGTGDKENPDSRGGDRGRAG